MWNLEDPNRDNHYKVNCTKDDHNKDNHDEDSKKEEVKKDALVINLYYFVFVLLSTNFKSLSGLLCAFFFYSNVPVNHSDTFTF